jgi:lipopolysaccharide transport system ATP-binding protein
MNKETVLQVKNLSKLYRLGEVGTGTLSDDFKRWWAKIRGKEDPFTEVGQTNDRTQKSKSDYVWALKDVNFDIKKGEVVGIIGKNGAGKSTLLKLISQITSPTSGTVKAKGRIASLLEVGTGMHPDMTARENIFMNGSILGMRKKEIEAKFDEIVDFAGCAMYIDTPIKRFSSGMKVRLGFAVAAFLEPEILIVDEVLAVGDAEFQQKAIGKMKEVSQGGGRTVLFVSHNMASIMELCDKCILMENGTVSRIGTVKEIIPYYLKIGNAEKITSNLELVEKRTGNAQIQFKYIELLDNNLNLIDYALSGQDIIFRIILKVNEIKEYPSVHVSMRFVDENDINLFHLSNSILTGKEFIIHENKHEIILYFKINKLPLNAGKYHFHLFCSDFKYVFDEINFAGELKVEGGNFYSSGKLPRNTISPFLIDAQFKLLEN